MNNIEINLVTLFKQRYKKVVLISVSLGLLIALPAYFFPHSYTATTTILPSKESGNSSFNTFLQSAASGLQLGAMGKASQSVIFAQVLRSKTIAERMLDTKIFDRLNIFPPQLSKEKRIKIIQKSIEVDVDKAGLITFDFGLNTGFFPSRKDKDTIAFYTAYLTNFAMIALDDILREKNIATSKKTRSYIQNELNKYYAILDTSSALMEKFQSKNNVLSLDEQTKATITQVIAMSAELTRLENELNMASLQYEKSSPIILSLKKQIEFLKDKISQVQKGTLLENNDFSVSLDKIPSLTKEYSNIFRSKKILEQVVYYLETQKHQEAIQEEKDVPIVDVLDKAIAPEDPSSPNKRALLAIGMALGFIFSSLYFVFIEYKVQKKLQKELNSN